MFMYLFLFTAIASSSPKLSNTDTESSSFAEAMADREELQELIAIFTAKETIEETVEPEQVSAPTEITVKTTQPITITNAIEPSMLEYKHWTGTYSPEIFTIAIDGTEVAQGAQHTLPAETKAVDVAFNYSFMNGMRKGTKTVTYDLHENSTQAKITFSWKDDWQVLVDNGTAVKKVST